MSETLQYRGYTGTVQYSAEDKLLFGHVLGVRGLISYEGASVEDLQADFRAALDDYIGDLEKAGVIDSVPPEGALPVFLTGEVRQLASQYAKEHELSLATVVQQALAEFFTRAA